MTRQMGRVAAAATIVVLASLACGGSFSTANIGEAWLATDAEGGNRTTTFSQDATLNLFVRLNNAPDDTALKVSWLAVDAEGMAANTLIYETEFTSGDDVVRFYVTNEDLWPIGAYKADVYLNGEFNRSLAFEVR